MLLSNAPLYYPSAREWMWNYCIYLGPFTDSNGENYDLGIHISYEEIFKNHHYSNATVYGNEAGEYMSGDFFGFEIVDEVVRRANNLNLIEQKSNWHKDNPKHFHLFPKEYSKEQMSKSYEYGASTPTFEEWIKTI